MNKQFIAAKKASHSLSLLSDDKRNEVLRAVADAIVAHAPSLLDANRQDLDRMDKSNPMYDRLMLTEDRLKGIADDMRHVATLPSPLGRVLKDKTLPNGLHLRRVSVPFGVIGMVYEARPNVTFDVFSLCFKSGNACVLKGGKDAQASCETGVSLIKDVLRQHDIDPSAVELLPFTHEATGEMLTAVGYIDLCIPRGGKRLIQFVRDNAKVPVIETGAGVVHCYFDQDGDLDMGRRIILNAKTRRPSVCNALDCIIIHSSRLSDLPQLVAPLSEKGVVLHADERAYQAPPRTLSHQPNIHASHLITHPRDARQGRRNLGRGMAEPAGGREDCGQSRRSARPHCTIRQWPQREHRDQQQSSRGYV